MEKRFRDYLKHFEKLDFDVLSDEEIQDEKSNLELKIMVLHQELVRLLIIMACLAVCASIFLATGLMIWSIICFVIGAILLLGLVYVCTQYCGIVGIIKKLERFVDRFTMM